MTRQKAIISWSIAEFMLLAVLVILWISEAVSTTVFLILMIAIGVISSGIVFYIIRKLPPKDGFNNENTY
jgi:di/tricarboxylate transporter